MTDTNHPANPPASGGEEIRRLRARAAELEQAIDAAPGWGAAVGAMAGELKGVQRRIIAFEKEAAAIAAPPPKPDGGVAPAASDVLGWHTMFEQPRAASKVIALYNDGSGAALIYIHDGGAINSDGDDCVWPGDSFDRWAYLPADLEFFCELCAEEPMTLPVSPLTAPPLNTGPEVGGGGEAIDRLTELNKAATPGAWYVVDTPWGNGDWISAGNPDPHAGKAVCNFDFLDEDREDDGPTPQDDAAFVAALVTVYRSGLLTRASFAKHYLERTLDLAKEVRELKARLAPAPAEAGEDLAGLSAREVADYRVLLGYLRGEGAARYGQDGAVIGDSPAEVAIKIMRAWDRHLRGAVYPASTDALEDLTGTVEAKDKIAVANRVKHELHKYHNAVLTGDEWGIGICLNRSEWLAVISSLHAATTTPAASRPVERGDPVAWQGCDPDEPYDPLKCAIWAALVPFQHELLQTGGVTFMGLRNSIVEAVRSFAIASQRDALAPAASRPAVGRDQLAEAIGNAAMENGDDPEPGTLRDWLPDGSAEIRDRNLLSAADAVLALMADPRDDTRAGGDQAQEGGR